MRPQVALIRALSSEFIRRKIKALTLTFGVASVLVLTIACWLTIKNAWWLLITVPVLILVCCGFAALFLMRTFLQKLRPTMTQQQMVGVKNFVDKLERVTENLHTPMFIIVFKVLRDLRHPSQASYITAFTKDGATLHKDLLELERQCK